MSSDEASMNSDVIPSANTPAGSLRTAAARVLLPVMFGPMCSGSLPAAWRLPRTWAAPLAQRLGGAIEVTTTPGLGAERFELGQLCDATRLAREPPPLRSDAQCALGNFGVTF